jgi:hypothetical protein
MKRELRFICEEWLPCPNYETSYEVSNLGRVRSIDRVSGKRKGIVKGKILVQTPNRRRYLEVRLFNNGESIPKIVHRLIAKAFISNPNDLPQVNHKDGDKKNNSVVNLEWITNSENQKYAYKLGLQPSRAGENNNKAKITDKDVTLLKQLYNSGMSIIQVSNSTNINMSTIRQIIYGRTWKLNATPILKRDDRFKPTTIS